MPATQPNSRVARRRNSRATPLLGRVEHWLELLDWSTQLSDSTLRRQHSSRLAVTARSLQLQPLRATGLRQSRTDAPASHCGPIGLPSYHFPYRLRRDGMGPVWNSPDRHWNQGVRGTALMRLDGRCSQHGGQRRDVPEERVRMFGRADCGGYRTPVDRWSGPSGSAGTTRPARPRG